MRRSAVLGGLASMATAAAMLVGVGPASASSVSSEYHSCVTPYGTIMQGVTWSSTGAELQYDLYSPVPIGSESSVSLWTSGQGYHVYKYPANNGGAGGTWHYYNVTDHPAARQAVFNAIIGPDSRYVCETDIDW
jgi:hypothetical protein